MRCFMFMLMLNHQCLTSIIYNRVFNIKCIILIDHGNTNKMRQNMSQLGGSGLET